MNMCAAKTCPMRVCSSNQDSLPKIQSIMERACISGWKDIITYQSSSITRNHNSSTTIVFTVLSWFPHCASCFPAGCGIGFNRVWTLIQEGVSPTNFRPETYSRCRGVKKKSFKRINKNLIVIFFFKKDILELQWNPVKIRIKGLRTPSYLKRVRILSGSH